jgi:hypothetical protein
MAEIEYTKNLQSPAQFQRGDSLTVRAGTVTELCALLEEAGKNTQFWEFFGQPKVVVEDVTDEAKPPSDIEALANIQKHLGKSMDALASAQKPASPAQIAVAAKKSGKPVSELQGISEAEAKELIKKGAA